MKGRKPKDVGFKILNGNAGHRPIVDSSKGQELGKEEEFVQSSLEKPADMDRYASAKWDELTSKLHIVLTESDASMVMLAATTYSTIMRCHRALKKSFTYKTKNKHGQVMIRQRPEVSILAQAQAQYYRALAELGGSPVARTRVKTLPKTTQQELPGINRFFTA